MATPGVGIGYPSAAANVGGGPTIFWKQAQTQQNYKHQGSNLVLERLWFLRPELMDPELLTRIRNFGKISFCRFLWARNTRNFE